MEKKLNFKLFLVFSLCSIPYTKNVISTQSDIDEMFDEKFVNISAREKLSNYKNS